MAGNRGNRAATASVTTFYSVVLGTLMLLPASSSNAADISWNAGSGVWNTSPSNANWTGSTHLYSEGDTVTFPDVVNQNDTTIMIGNVANGGVAPASVTINNSTTSYTISIDYGIINDSTAAATGLLKTGSGTATIATTQNQYTGFTKVTGGTLAIKTSTTNNIGRRADHSR